jgi:hypothetical protein
MEVSARIRLGIATGVLATLYYFLLTFLIGWIMATHWPAWWFGVFPTRHIAATAWLVTLHTIAVIAAALPIAIACVVIARDRAVQLGVIASTLMTLVSILPLLRPTIWPLVWGDHPMFFVTDRIKIIVAVPFVAWLIRVGSSNHRLERSRVASSVSQGGDR